MGLYLAFSCFFLAVQSSAGHCSTPHGPLKMSAPGVSPSSSPRLPSPPPFTEVQIGPQSPSVGDSFGGDADLQLLGVSPGADEGPTRRIRPGSKTSEMAAGPPLIPLPQVSKQVDAQPPGDNPLRLLTRLWLIA